MRNSRSPLSVAISQSSAIQRQFSLRSSHKPAGDQPEAIESLVASLLAGAQDQVLLGVTGSGKTFTAANVIAQLQRPAMIIAPNKTLAAQLYSEMQSLFPDNAVEYFVSYYDYYQPEAYVPSSDTYIEKDASINEQIERMRLAATKALLERQDAIIVATVSAIYGLGDPSSYLDMVLPLKTGTSPGDRRLLRWLADMQYSRNDVELKRGTYRARGDVIDIFPAESEREAIRVQLFDDKIESLTRFDPLTGEMIGKETELTIHPKSHYVTRKEVIDRAIVDIQQELRLRLEQLRADNQLLEAQRLEQRTRYDVEMMLELGYCNGIENYSRYLSGRKQGEPPPTLFDYLPAGALLFIDESHVTVPQLGAMYKGDRSRKETLVRYGFRLPSALDNRPLKFEEFVQQAPQTVYVSATPGQYELKLAGKMRVVEQLVRPTGLVDPTIEVRPVVGQMEDLLSEIELRVVRGERVLVTTLTKRMAENLSEYLNEHGKRVKYLHSDINTVERVEILRDLRMGEIDVVVGINLLREGLDLPEVSLVAVLDADKEGFLRSATTLIQTVGRAARNLNGQAIFYADKITKSMRHAIMETDRRRSRQQQYNKQHNITPIGIIKQIADPMHLAVDPHGRSKAAAKDRKEAGKWLQLVDNPKKLAAAMKRMERDMLNAAQQLEFEQAASLRDELQSLHDAALRHSMVN